MKALLFDKTLNLVDMPAPVPGSDEALIRVRLAGICNTDMEILKGYMGFQGILGHEFVGEVITSPDPTFIGKRVLGEINLGCGQCPACLSDMARHCPTRRVLGIWNKDGVFAEYQTLPIENLIKVSNHLSDSAAVFVEPLAAACEILEQIHIQPDMTVGIIGDGKLAQLIARVLRLTGCGIWVIGKHPEKLDLLRSLNIQTAMVDHSPEMLFDVVVEASGSPSGFELALSLVKPRGWFVLKSTTHEAIWFNPAKLVIEEIQLVGSRCGRFEPALRLLESGQVDVRPLVSAVFPIAEWEEAFSVAQEKPSLKVLLNFAADSNEG